MVLNTDYFGAKHSPLGSRVGSDDSARHCATGVSMCATHNQRPSCLA